MAGIPSMLEQTIKRFSWEILFQTNFLILGSRELNWFSHFVKYSKINFKPKRIKSYEASVEKNHKIT